MYRKYRSKSLDEIVGQSHITDILRRAIANGNVAHAYLLTGPRGVGKTSIARILAHEINQLEYTDESSHLDIIEIDAASNNSVDDIRDLRERVQVAPVSAKRKIYIIDEVHMLSKSAFNALLKTLEEPPSHVVFILATTDVEKLPSTITSRTQRFNFHTVSEDEMVAHLAHIAVKEDIKIDDEALRLIARHSGGSFRDAISMLDQLRHSSDTAIGKSHIEHTLGLATDDTISHLIDAHLSGDIATIVATLNASERQGTAASTLVGQIISYINDHVVDNPSLLPLLDDLLETSRTAWPYVRLLTALGGAKHRHGEVVVRSSEIVESKSKAKAAVKTKPEPKPVEEEATEQSAVDSSPETTEQEAEPIDDRPAETSQDFDWSAFLARVKEQGASGAYTILAKSAYDFGGNKLTIFAGKKFNKTQLDKSLPKLAAALEALSPNTEIVTLASDKPPQDSQTAAVIDIMGGGKEVKL